MADDLPSSALEEIRLREQSRDVPSLVAAVEAVLAMHAPTAFTRYAEPCTAHLWSTLARHDCPDCKRVERAGCDRCRDENGNPARPEDCRERKAILAALQLATEEEAGDVP